MAKVSTLQNHNPYHSLKALEHIKILFKGERIWLECSVLVGYYVIEVMLLSIYVHMIAECP